MTPTFKTILFSLYYSDNCIRGFFQGNVLYKFTFYLLTLLSLSSLSRTVNIIKLSMSEDFHSVLVGLGVSCFLLAVIGYL